MTTRQTKKTLGSMTFEEFKSLFEPVFKGVISGQRWQTELKTRGYEPSKLNWLFYHTKTTTPTKKKKEWFLKELVKAEALREKNILIKLSEAKTSAELSSLKLLLEHFCPSFNTKERKELNYNLVMMLMIVKKNVSKEQFNQILRELGQLDEDEMLDRIDKVIDNI